MSAVEIAVFFLVVWWVVLFVTLPFGVRQVENPEPGMDTGAPERPRLGLKALVTTAITTIVTVVVYLLVESGLLPIREWLSP
jgi:predicted secreted protein